MAVISFLLRLIGEQAYGFERNTTTYIAEEAKVLGQRAGSGENGDDFFVRYLREIHVKLRDHCEADRS